MKTKNPILLSLFAFFLIFGLVSCNNDPCKGIICTNGGTCLDGSCLCQPGYEGADCSKETRARFLGSYGVSESCDNNPDEYQCLIQISQTAVVQVNFDNFYNLEQLGISLDVYGQVDGNTIEIPLQVVDEYTFEGDGTINTTTGTITIAYTVERTGQNPRNCSAVFILQ